MSAARRVLRNAKPVSPHLLLGSKALRIGVIGYGTVGASLVRFLKKRKHAVAIYDKYLDGYRSERDVEAVNDADLVFIAVPTPYDPHLGAADLGAVYDAISLVKSASICVKSTVPPGSFNAMERFVPRTLAYSPEYVGESKNHPWREIDACGFIVAAGHDEACALVRDAYCSGDSGENGIKFVRTDVATAELAKYMENCFLATKVAFVNQFWDLAQASGVDYDELRKIFLLDSPVRSGRSLRGLSVAGKPDLTTASAQQPVRVIVRFSLNGDTGSVVRNEIRDHFTGFTRTKTGTWESDSMPMHAATSAIRRMLRVLRDAESLTPERW
jgi:UDPglucose 6-dehydrogenase